MTLTIHTPYHELGTDSPRVPEWAERRRVYRTGGRTLYLVDTNSLNDAKRDLGTLKKRGWNVQIDRNGRSAASIALSRKAA